MFDDIATIIDIADDLGIWIYMLDKASLGRLFEWNYLAVPQPGKNV